jgi:hypothetical protein
MMLELWFRQFADRPAATPRAGDGTKGVAA